MKKLVFATMMCVAAMSAKAQVLTSETVNNVYEEVINQNDGEFVFNAERKGSDITTMYVYKEATGRKGDVSLKPHLKYAYTYAEDGMLTARVAYRWSTSLSEWVCAARYDYTLSNDSYCVDYSRYNHSDGRFDQPVDRMVYTLQPDDHFNYVSAYHRNRPTASFFLVYETAVAPQPLLAKK